MNPHHRIMPYVAAIAGIGVLAMMDGFMKFAAIAAGAYSATLLRALIAAAIAAPLWLLQRPKMPRGKVLHLHVERGVISAFMALSWFFALTKLPIAEAIAISFIAPLIALYFARIFLGEQISRNAVLASVLGLIGTIVIVSGRLSIAGLDRDLLLGLASLFFSALLYAYNFVVIRKQSQVAGPLEVATFHSGIGAAVLLLAAPFAFTMPPITQIGWIAVAGALTIAGSMIITWAYARAQAQALVPLEYTGFLWAMWIGWQFFDEAVTAATLTGAVLIVIGSWIASTGRTAQVDRPETA